MFIFFMFLVTLTANAFGGEVSALKIKSVDTISSVQMYHQDVIASKSSDLVISNVQRNDGLFINNRRLDNLGDLGFGIDAIIASNQFQNLIAYIYNQSFLHNKSNVHFSVVLSEIQPNAP